MRRPKSLNIRSLASNDIDMSLELFRLARLTLDQFRNLIPRRFDRLHEPHHRSDRFAVIAVIGLQQRSGYK